MSLSLQSRSLGDIAVVTCVGRIVEGSDATALEAYVKELLPVQPHILLDLRDVSFIDSAGLGILVRLLTRARTAHGDLKLCTVSPHLREVLRSTKLHTILAAYNTEVDAVAAFCAPTDSAEAPASLDIDIVCVDPSPDVLACLRAVLRQAGYGATTTTNLADARILIRADAGRKSFSLVRRYVPCSRPRYPTPAVSWNCPHTFRPGTPAKWPGRCSIELAPR